MISVGLIPISGSAEAVKTVLTGNPAGKKLTPANSEIILSKEVPVELSPYSLTVLRVKTK